MQLDRNTRVSAWIIVVSATIIIVYQVLGLRVLAPMWNNPETSGMALLVILLMKVLPIVIPVLIVFGGVLLFRSGTAAGWLFSAAVCVWFITSAIRTVGVRSGTYHVRLPLELVDVCSLVLAVIGLVIVGRIKKDLVQQV